MVRKTKKTMTKKTSKKPRIGRPPMGHECPLLSFGVVHRGLDGWRIVLSEEPARVRVKPEHIDDAVPGSDTYCVFALAFADHFGPEYDVHINATVTKVISQKDKVELRLYTPMAIRKKLVDFDRLHFWDLPPGIYRFGPIAKAVRTGKHVRKAAAVKRKKAKNGTSVVVNKQQGSINRRVPKKNVTATRVISRNATIRWTKKRKSKKVA